MDSRSGQEAGFTLIEVLVAAAVLVVGLLGVVALLDTANHTTSTSLAREGATTLARDVLERARQQTYGSITTSAVRSALPDTTTSVDASSFKLTRRGRTYTVTFAACKMDSSADGVGVHDAGFCDWPDAAPAGSVPPAANGTGASLGLKLLGIPLNVNASGSVTTAVCGLLGLNTIGAVPVLSSLLGPSGAVNGLLSMVRGGANVGLCASASTSYALDDTPDDMTRVTTTVAWTRSGRTRTVAQSTLIPNPGVA